MTASERQDRGAIESTHFTNGHMVEGRKWEAAIGISTVAVQLLNSTGMQIILSHRQVDDSERSPREGRSISRM